MGNTCQISSCFLYEFVCRSTCTYRTAYIITIYHNGVRTNKYMNIFVVIYCSRMKYSRISEIRTDF